MYLDFTICSVEKNLSFLKTLFPTSKILLKGEILKSGKKIPYNEFSFIFQQGEFYYINDMLSSFKNYISKEMDSLCEYIKLNQLKSSVSIVMDKEYPAISISNDNLLFLIELNASIDFDFI